MLEKSKKIRFIFCFACLMVLGCGGGGVSDVSTMSITADPPQINPGGRSTITVACNSYDADLTLEGEPVSWHIRENESGGELQVINNVLDGGGKAVALYKAGPRHGVDIVEVSVPGGSRATTTVRVGDGVVIGSVNLEVHPDSTGHMIRVLVLDVAGIPAVGVTVHFSVSSGELSTSEEETDNYGYARATFCSPHSATVWVNVGGISANAKIGGTPGICPAPEAPEVPE